MAKKKFQPNERTKLFILIYQNLLAQNRFKSGADLLRMLGEDPVTYKATLSSVLKPSINIPDNFFIKFCNHFKLDMNGNPIPETGGNDALQEEVRELRRMVLEMKTDYALLKQNVITLLAKVG